VTNRGRPRALPESVKQARGTAQPCRARRPTVPSLDGDPIRPSWLTARARAIWDEKTAIYAERHQPVRGCEGTLAQYCQLEAELERRWRKGIDIPIAMVTAHRLYAGEFYDTSASRWQAPVGRTADNPFARNGTRPPLRLA